VEQIVDRVAVACDDDIPCKFEIDNKLISGKLMRSFEAST
jgi:hypothetical protein